MENNKKQLQEKYNELIKSFNPWKQQVVIETPEKVMAIELRQTDKEFHLLNITRNTLVKGINEINEKVSSMISNNLVSEIYVNAL